MNAKSRRSGLVLCAAVLGLLASTPRAEAAPQTAEIAVPGGMKALADVLQIQPLPEPALYAAEIARLVYDPTDGFDIDRRARPANLELYFATLTRLRAALAPLDNGHALTLAAAADSKTRDRLRDVFEILGLRLRENRRQYTVEATKNPEAATRVALLEKGGISVGALSVRLNKGETVSIAIASDLVPIPLAAEVWMTTVFEKRVPADELFPAIMLNRDAALLCHGLAGVDDETLQFVADHPRLLTHLRDNAALLAAFASNFHVRNGRVVPPGGEAAASVWEAAIDERLDDADKFARKLFSGDGRLAYLYDLVAELDEARASFVLGSWIAEPRLRVERFKALAEFCESAYHEWQVRERPFTRPVHDLASLILNVAVRPDGQPTVPSVRRFWERVLEDADLSPVSPQQVREMERDAAIDAAWFAATLLPAEPRVRDAHIRQAAFAFRVFHAADTAALGDLLTAVRAFPTYESLLLTFERAGLTRPATYAAAARRAERLSELDGPRAHVMLSQFQGAVVLLARLREIGVIDRERAGSLADALIAIELKDDSYGGAIADWLQKLLPEGSVTAGAEDALLAALSGAADNRRPASKSVSWEGDRYVLDLPGAELAALRRARSNQHAYSLDTALGLRAVAKTLEPKDLDLDRIHQSLDALKALLSDLPPRPKAQKSDTILKDLADPRDLVQRAIKDLTKITKPKDAKKGTQWSAPLAEVSDIVLADVMSSLAYALSLSHGHAVPPPFNDAARRHDFGLAMKDAGTRRRTAWALPVVSTEPGVPWHAVGSLLGLDVTISSQMLRRVSAEGVPRMPKLGASDIRVFEHTVGLLNPFVLTDVDRDAIQSAVAHGRARVAGLTIETLDALTADVRMDGWRRRALQWTLEHGPADPVSFFSLTELLVLGGGDPSRLDAWGMALVFLDGCLCTRLSPPNAWRLLLGRQQLGLLSAAVPDLQLRVALALADASLPAPLARLVMSAATRDFLDGVRPRDGNDWLTIVRTAQAVTKQQIDDYVAAAVVADGPLVRDTAPRAEAR